MRCIGGQAPVARFHHHQAQHVQSRKKRYDEQDALGLSVDEPNQRVRARQKLRLKAVGFITQISQNPTPERRSSNGHETEKTEIHSNDSCRNRNQMTNYWKKPREKDSACLVASEPFLSLLQLFSSYQHKPAILCDYRNY